MKIRRCPGSPSRTAGVALSALLVAALAACGGGKGGTDDVVVAAPSGAGTPASAAATVSPAVALDHWSNPATWGGELPKAGDRIAIPAGRRVVLDGDTPALAGLVVEGTLVADPSKHVSITSAYIVVAGPEAALRIGTADAPHRNRARITLTGSDATAQALDLAIGSKLLAALRGATLDLHGEPRMAWTRLESTAAAGSTRLQLLKTTGWRAGDRIAIAPSGLQPSETETATIVAVDGNTVTLERPLAHAHFGEVAVFDGTPVDMRAEVGLLSRNVVVEGDAGSADSGFGGQIRIATESTGRLSGVELRRMGQKALLGMYPLHFHLLGDGGAGQYLRNSSVHQAYNRAVTIHGSNRVAIEDNVTAGSVGHTLFIEDGNEENNRLVGNLVLDVRPAKPGEEVLKEVNWPVFVANDRMPAGIWNGNPNNVIRDNVVAGVDNGWAYWHSFRAAPTGNAAGLAGTLFPRRVAWGEFSGNVAHSTAQSDRGQFTDYGVNGGALMMEHYEGAEPALIRNFTAYNAGGIGVWLTRSRLVGARIADSPNALMAESSTVEDLVLVARSKNSRTAGVQSLGLNHIRGHDNMTYKGVRFFNYDCTGCNDQAVALAFSSNRTQYFRKIGTFQGMKFNGASRPIAFDTQFFGENQAMRDAAHSVMTDLDGSLAGRPGNLVFHNPLTLPASCTPPPAGSVLALCPPGVEPRFPQ